jgi:hypothetical protein
MIRGTLRNVSKNGHTRTNEIVGAAVSAPVIGESFILYAKPLDPEMDFREITTSPVQAVEPPDENGEVRFRTLNTDYSWTPHAD